MRQPCARIARPCRWRHELPVARAGYGVAHHALLRQPYNHQRPFTASRVCSAKAPMHEWPALIATTKSGKKTAHTSKNSLLTLAIETSCDDTCVAILEKESTSTGRATATLHFNDKVTADSRGFKGVYPDAAVASHVSSMAPLLQRALGSLPDATPVAGSATNGQAQVQVGDNTVWIDGRPRRKPDFVTVTRGPGMMSNLTVGVMTAKSLAVSWDVPLLAVNHMEAHALTPRLVHALEEAKPDKDNKQDETPSPPSTAAPSHQPEFPFLSVLVSGGHSLLVHSRALNNHSILAQATNIAIGDLLDKCARLILPESYIDSAKDVMYGRLLEEFAFPPPPSSSPPPPLPPTSSATMHAPEEKATQAAAKEAAAAADMYNYTPPLTRPDEQKAHHSTPEQGGWWLTPPMHESAAMGYDFSGLNGRVKTILSENPDMSLDQRRELAKQTMRLAFEHLASRLIMALRKFAKQAKEEEMRAAYEAASQVTHEGEHGASISVSASSPSEPGDDNQRQPQTPQTSTATTTSTTTTPRVKTVVVSGGVASNRYLRHILRSMLDVRGFSDVQIVCPPVSLCTDNAAMIAWAGMEMYEAGWRSALEVRPMKKWPLDPESAGGGILGADGWYKEDGEA